MEHMNPDDAIRAPVELTEEQIAAVAGGLNPQPLPPRVDPHSES